MTRNCFTFTRLYAQAIESLPDDQALLLMKAIYKYALEGIEPTELSLAADTFFEFIKKDIDIYTRRTDG